jgi:PTS system nitrogen regulatory IIA component
MPDTLPEKDILTAEEVADYLRISERTVYQWAQKGEMPAGKLGATWRFKRSEVVKWIDDRLGAGMSRTPTSEMRLTDVLRQDRVLSLEMCSKEEVLRRLIDCLGDAPEVEDKDGLTRAVYRREQLMSTGIGLGVGVPHVRLASVRDVVAALGLCEQGIDDYETLDDEPVRIVCLVAAGKDQHAQYLRLLSGISRRLKDPDARRELLDAPDAETAYRMITR